MSRYFLRSVLRACSSAKLFGILSVGRSALSFPEPNTNTNTNGVNNRCGGQYFPVHVHSLIERRQRKPQRRPQKRRAHNEDHRHLQRRIHQNPPRRRHRRGRCAVRPRLSIVTVVRGGKEACPRSGQGLLFVRLIAVHRSERVGRPIVVMWWRLGGLVQGLHRWRRGSEEEEEASEEEWEYLCVCGG